MKMVQLFIVIATAVTFSGCAGVGPNGEWTSQDTTAVVDAAARTYGLYDRVKHPERYPAPSAPY